MRSHAAFQTHVCWTPAGLVFRALRLSLVAVVPVAGVAGSAVVAPSTVNMTSRSTGLPVASTSVKETGISVALVSSLRAVLEVNESAGGLDVLLLPFPEEVSEAAAAAPAIAR
jgi:hypothetical protein